MHILRVCIFILFIPVVTNAQNIIEQKKDGKFKRITCNKKASYENINGKINISIITDDNEILELNNIDESVFKCNTKLRSKNLKIIFIKENNEVTFVSSGIVKVFIRCDKNDHFNVSFSGNLSNKKSIINVTSTLQVKQSPKENLITN